MKTRFLADADFNQDLVKAILRRQPEIDIRVAIGGELRCLSDSQVLAIAATERRVLLSHDRKTMPYAFGAFIATASSPGVFIISQRADRLAVIEDLLTIWASSDAAEWVNRICTLPL